MPSVPFSSNSFKSSLFVSFRFLVLDRVGFDPTNTKENGSVVFMLVVPYFLTCKDIHRNSLRHNDEELVCLFFLFFSDGLSKVGVVPEIGFEIIVSHGEPSLHQLYILVHISSMEKRNYL